MNKSLHSADIERSLWIVGVACLCAASAWAPLLWDGSGYALSILASGKGVILHGRFGAALLHLPTAASLIIGSKWFSLTVFSLTYTLVPMLSLYVTYRLLTRLGREDLLVWPFLAISGLTVWGQSFWVSEALVAAQLFWIVWVWLFLLRRITPEFVLAVVALLSLHPATGVLMVVLALSALFHPTRQISTRTRIRWAGVFLILGVLRVLLMTEGYESQESSLHWMVTETARAVSVPMIVGLVAALGFLALRVLGRSHRVEVWALWILAASSAIWAIEPSFWRDALEFRRLFVPLTAVAALGALRALRREAQSASHGHLMRLASVFALVVLIQSFHWHTLQREVADHVSKMSSCCEDYVAAEVYRDTALHHWGTVYLSVVVQQSLIPSRLLSNQPCPNTLSEGHITPRDAPALRNTAKLLDLSHLGQCS